VFKTNQPLVFVEAKAQGFDKLERSKMWDENAIRR